MLWAAGGALQAWFDGFGLTASPGLPRGIWVYDTGVAGPALRAAQTWCRKVRLVGGAPLLLARKRVVRALAAALVAGGDRAVRCERLLGRKWKWAAGLVDRYETRFAGERPRRRGVERWLGEDRRLGRALERYGARIRIADPFADTPGWNPVEAARAWELPRLGTLGELAGWLRLRPEELEWFADRKGIATVGKFGHYLYRRVVKRSGALRLLEEPRPRLKLLQGAVLRDILNRVPVHGAAHGFVRGRSIRTFAAPHVGREVVLRMDLADFFPGIGGARVAGFFRLAGYPEAVADRLAGLCVNAAPAAALHGFGDAGELYRRRHLPQGAPTSPALANILSHRLDERLSGLAAAAGGVYTRYADDLAFSGDGAFARRVGRFAAHGCAVALEEGFRINHRKTRIMRQGERQSLTGLVVNRRLGTGRAEYDSLKALLHNCAKTGAAAQNREGRGNWQAHLQGRVAFVESVHAERGARLRTLLGQVRWG